MASSKAFSKDTRVMMDGKELFNNTLRKAAHAWKGIIELRLSGWACLYLLSKDKVMVSSKRSGCQWLIRCRSLDGMHKLNLVMTPMFKVVAVIVVAVIVVAAGVVGFRTW